MVQLPGIRVIEPCTRVKVSNVKFLEIAVDAIIGRRSYVVSMHFLPQQLLLRTIHCIEYFLHCCSFESNLGPLAHIFTILAVVVGQHCTQVPGVGNERLDISHFTWIVQLLHLERRERRRRLTYHGVQSENCRDAI